MKGVKEVRQKLAVVLKRFLMTFVWQRTCSLHWACNEDHRKCFLEEQIENRFVILLVKNDRNLINGKQGAAGR